MIKVQTLKGFRDFLPKEAKKRQYVINILKQVFESYGFEALETPTLEYEEILTGKYGKEADKLMYRFEDLGGRKVALRYDQTVPLARVVTQYQNELPKPFKRYQIQPVFRADNTQKGRYREFLQCDIDTVNSPSLFADAEIISCVFRATKKLGFNNVKMLINDRIMFNNIKPDLIAVFDKLEKVGTEKTLEELESKGMDKNTAEELLITKQLPPNLVSLFDYLTKFGLREGKDYSFTPYLARGLDYYTSTIFELRIEDYGNLSVGGGGRYDDLIGMFAGKQIPAVGFAFGFDRLIEAMEILKLFPPNLTVTKVLVTVFSQDLKDKSLEITQMLRNQNINAEIYPDLNAKIDRQLKYANQKEIPFALIIGPNESSTGTATVKNMSTGKQETVSQNELSGLLKA